MALCQNLWTIRVCSGAAKWRKLWQELRVWARSWAQTCRGKVIRMLMAQKRRVGKEGYPPPVSNFEMEKLRKVSVLSI